jgi:hypothetical protein
MYMYEIWLKPYMMKDKGIRHRDTLVWKEVWKVIYFAGFLITLNVILIISSGKLPIFPIKLWGGTLIGFPSSKNDLYFSLIEIGLLIWTYFYCIHNIQLGLNTKSNNLQGSHLGWPVDSGDDFFYYVHCILTLLLMFPFGEGCSPSFEEFWNSLTRLISSMVNIGQTILEETKM